MARHISGHFIPLTAMFLNLSISGDTGGHTVRWAFVFLQKNDSKVLFLGGEHMTCPAIIMTRPLSVFFPFVVLRVLMDILAASWALLARMKGILCPLHQSAKNLGDMP
jgi:hypothetical protein